MKTTLRSRLAHWLSAADGEALRRQIGEAAAQEERNRLARDLHDSIKQQLFSINVGTATAQERWERDPEGAKAALADVRRSAKEAMVEMQALLHQLRPEALTSTGLVEALREQCEALGYRTGAEVTLELGEALTDDRLLPGTQEALFRIAQEALANVARHARASQVRVHLDCWGERWAVLKVEDDGQGFDPSVKASGMGLRNLRERTESLGGSLEVISKPGSGARIVVHIPLVASSAEWEARLEADGSKMVLGLTVMSIGITMPQMSTYPPRGIEFFFVGILLFQSALTWIFERVSLRWISGAPLKEVSRLFYVRHRNWICCFLFLGFWASWYWNVMPGNRTGWRVTWGAAALLGVALAGLELIRFHRWSRFRRSWPKWNPALAKKRWLQLGALSMVFLAAVLTSPPSKLAWACPFAAVILYLFTRQPRMEEAAP